MIKTEKNDIYWLPQYWKILISQGWQQRKAEFCEILCKMPNSSISSCFLLMGLHILPSANLRMVPQVKVTNSLRRQKKKSRRCRGLSLPYVHAWGLSGLTLDVCFCEIRSVCGERSSLSSLWVLILVYSKAWDSSLCWTEAIPLGESLISLRLPRWKSKYTTRAKVLGTSQSRQQGQGQRGPLSASSESSTWSVAR